MGHLPQLTGRNAPDVLTRLLPRGNLSEKPRPAVPFEDAPVERLNRRQEHEIVGRFHVTPPAAAFRGGPHRSRSRRTGPATTPDASHRLPRRCSTALAR